uniref:NADH dehydrogenase subunit 6 n=1 Tax=Aplos simplex TaxID=2837358 RepID=UPI002A82B0BA|nr:NADH dehydrogenase subunit 6 [Aplos simplex]WOW98876.1 NADH dehydrogenase subunit 6 [Aplos simplex]
MMAKMMMFTSTTIPMMKHPMSMGTILILQTIMMSIYMSKKSMNSWFSYILFITIIGGMMIMFMYMSSIASNEMFKPKSKKIMMMITTFTLIMMMNTEMMTELNKLIEQKMNMMEKEEIKASSKFFNSKKMNMTIIMMMILMLTMVSITNISSTFEGPLKKTYV